MEGPGIMRCQELLDGLGFDYGDNDGVYGPKTRKAVKDFQGKVGLKTDGICGPKTWAAILDDTDTDVVDPVGIIDIRNKHKPPRLYGYERKPLRVLGLVLHQTGCPMPRNSKKWGRLNAHIGITQEGKAILVNDFTDMIWHAQKLSMKTIGIEIEGNYMGVEGRPSTLWKPGGGPDSLNPKMLTALAHVFEYLQDWFYEHSEWKYIFAHRQAFSGRVSDPGEQIWRQVALPWMEITGASDGGENHFIGSGNPIPAAWDIRYNNSF